MVSVSARIGPHALSLSALGRPGPHRHRPAGPRGLCLGPHRPTSPLSLGLHRPGERSGVYWKPKGAAAERAGPSASARPALASPGPSRSAPVHCGGPQRITSLLVQTSTSQLNLVINYKHHIGSSLPSPNISRAAPRSYAHQSHVYTSSGWSSRSRR